MIKNNKAAIYCRLSKDDEQIGDSVSIETQKLMLTKYCTEHKFDIFDTYIDDGYSGLNFNRPSFKHLIEDLENNKFNIVITKDLSRLGRDYIQTGYYIDVYFTTKQVRYIAVNDGIDTQQENNDIAPFKNILNDMYAKDLSRKVKSAKQQRAQNGLYISSQPPYGYKVNPFNRNQLVIDNESAQIVKMIFDLAEEGKNYSQISRILKARKIITPSVYKAMNGDTRFLKYAENQDQIYNWPYQTIKSIISNPVYVGDMVNHKVETVNYKTKKRVRVPIDEQIIVPNKHEAIIIRERFETINKRLSRRRKANHKFENIYKGLIYCSECGEELQMISKQLKYETKPMFRCHQHIRDSQICTHYHFIYYEELCTEIKNQLDIRIAEIVNSEIYLELCKIILESLNKQVSEANKSKRQKELMLLNKKIKEYYRNTAQRYSDSIIPDELEALLKQQKMLTRQLTEFVDEGTLPSDSHFYMTQIQYNVKKYLHNINLTAETLKLFVKKIEIGHLEKTSNGVHQKIKIHYRF